MIQIHCFNTQIYSIFEEFGQSMKAEETINSHQMHKWVPFSRAQRKPCMQNFQTNLKTQTCWICREKNRNCKANVVMSRKKKEMLFSLIIYRMNIKGKNSWIQTISVYSLSLIPLFNGFFASTQANVSVCKSPHQTQYGHFSQNIKMRPWSPTRTSVTCFPTCGERGHLHRFRRIPTCKVRTSWFWGPCSEITDPSSCSSSSSFSCSASLPGTWMHPRHSIGCSVVGEREKVSSILLLQTTGFKY